MSINHLLKAASEYEEALSRCLVLDAARNIISPGARALLGSRLVEGDLVGRPTDWGAQFGAAPAMAIEELLRSLVHGLFGTPYVEPRAPSGSLANGFAALAVTTPGDVVMVPPQWAFGHRSLGDQGYLGVAARRVVEMPWDGAAFGPDLEGLRRALMKERPRLVVMGLSRCLFPEPMAEVAELVREVGAMALYDGAHVLGLIAGGAFPNPLSWGFDFLTGSTHKTLPGPMGGAIICRQAEHLEAVASLCDRCLSTYSQSRVAALTYALAEMVSDGMSYATQVVRNARHLAHALAAQGFRIVGADRGFTSTHQVLVDITGLLELSEVTQRLADAGILISRPFRADHRLRGGSSDGWWLRIGTSVVTRLGMQADDMLIIARILGRLLLHRENPSSVGATIVGMMARFKTAQYLGGG